MAHEITMNKKTGLYEFAYRESHGAAWHGLGAAISDTATVDDWKKDAGMDWEIFESVVGYQTPAGQEMYTDKKVLFRSDTNEALSVVGAKYNVVQPTEVLEFFRDLTTMHGFELSAAGTLFGGRRFWATAKIGKTFAASHGDNIEGQLLLASSCDGSIQTLAKLSTVRIVCANTMRLALADNADAIKISHKSMFDAKAVKLDLGLIDASWETFKTNIDKLVDVRISDSDAETYFKKNFYNPNVMAEDQTWKAQKDVQELMHLFRSGSGADMSYGTAWGVVNAVTEKFTHNNGKREASANFWDSEFGAGADIKSDVFSDMLALTV